MEGSRTENNLFFRMEVTGFTIEDIGVRNSPGIWNSACCGAKKFHEQGDDEIYRRTEAEEGRLYCG
jgi:hypothetical protein